MDPLLHYLNYQTFLRDFFEFKKRSHSFYSYRYLGGKLSLDPGFLVKVFQGKKHIANKSIPVITKFLKLDKNNSEYFELLVLYGKAKTNKDIKMYFEKLIAIQGVDAKEIQVNQYAFYQKWHHAAIRSLIGYFPFKSDYKELANKLSPIITIKEAKESIVLLENLKLIKKDKNGVYNLKDKVVTTGEKWQSAAIRNYQEETIDLAKESLERHEPGLRDISTVTLAVSHKDLEEIKERARQFRQSIMQMKTDHKVTDSVYQLNMQIIPLTKITKEKNV